MFQKINGYLAIPHELMHVIAYRMIGKRCAYKLGDLQVTALEPRTQGERLFCLLFPLLVNLLAVVLLFSIWIATYISAAYPIDPFAYFKVAPNWHRSLFLGGAFLLTYTSLSTIDVVVAIQFLAEKLRQQPPKKSQKQ